MVLSKATALTHVQHLRGNPSGQKATGRKSNTYDCSGKCNCTTIVQAYKIGHPSYATETPRNPAVHPTKMTVFINATESRHESAISTTSEHMDMKKMP